MTKVSTEPGPVKVAAYPIKLRRHESPSPAIKADTPPLKQARSSLEYLLQQLHHKLRLHQIANTIPQLFFKLFGSFSRLSTCISAPCAYLFSLALVVLSKPRPSLRRLTRSPRTSGSTSLSHNTPFTSDTIPPQSKKRKAPEASEREAPEPKVSKKSRKEAVLSRSTTPPTATTSMADSDDFDWNSNPDDGSSEGEMSFEEGDESGSGMSLTPRHNLYSALLTGDVM